MGRFLDLVKFFLPKSHAAEHVAVWQHKVAYTMAAIVLVLLLLPSGIELRYVDKVEAAEAHAAIEGRLDGVETQLKMLTDQNKAAAIRDIRLQIYELRERACKASGELRAVLNEQVQSLRSDFQAATGNEFPVVSCADLIGAAEGEQ